MTPAAFYYHFGSRDDLLEELVTEFSKAWVAHGETLWDQADTADEFTAVVSQLLDWAGKQEQAATVFFLSSVGASFAIENVREEARNQLIRAAGRALARMDPALTRSDSGVRATAAVLACEVAARSLLNRDDAYRTLGPRRFHEEILGLVATAVGM
jgi:AcrR family transcriptional regulator